MTTYAPIVSECPIHVTKEQVVIFYFTMNKSRWVECLAQVKRIGNIYEILVGKIDAW